MNYQFSPALSLRAIIDYNAVLANTAVVSYDTSKKVTGDLLLAYIPHPDTAVYLGYTNGRENLALLSEPAALVRTTKPILQTSAQAFVKISYLFRFEMGNPIVICYTRCECPKSWTGRPSATKSWRG